MCPHEEKLTAWLLGDLPPGEREAFARHLASCDGCRRAQEELSRVLTPLRSGLEKDRAWQAPGQKAPRSGREESPDEAEQADRPRHWAWLWSPNEGLKRVAVLALSFGTLFGMIGVVYQSLHPAPRTAGGVTYVSFLQEKEAPAPALVTDPEMKSDAAGQAPPAAAAPFPAEPEAPAVIANPAPPAPARQALAFPKIAEAEAARAATRKALESAPAKPGRADGAAAVAAAPVQAAKRERAKDEAAGRRLSADLIAKPVQLAGAAAPAKTAPTNAVPPTNSVPTNAVAPNARGQP